MYTPKSSFFMFAWWWSTGFMATMGREPHSRSRKEHMHSYINWDPKMMKTEVVGHDLSTSKLPPGTGKDTWDHVQRRALELASTSNLFCPLLRNKNMTRLSSKTTWFLCFQPAYSAFLFVSRLPLLHASTRDFSSFWVPFTMTSPGDPTGSYWISGWRPAVPVGNVVLP